MALVYSLTEGLANDLLEARYSSTEIPFKNTSEMIATLSAVYYDDNQGSKACEKLCTLEYNVADKEMDIHQFIGTVNSLADKAGIAKAERKTVLFEHIPADLDLRLLRDSKDPSISYEDSVTDAFARRRTAIYLPLWTKILNWRKEKEKKKERRKEGKNLSAAKCGEGGAL